MHYGPIRFAEKTSRNTIPADLLWEKNAVPTKKYKLKNTDYKRRPISVQKSLPVEVNATFGIVKCERAPNVNLVLIVLRYELMMANASLALCCADWMLLSSCVQHYHHDSTKSCGQRIYYRLSSVLLFGANATQCLSVHIRNLFSIFIKIDLDSFEKYFDII